MPLSRAAGGGNQGVVKLEYLLGREDVNPDTLLVDTVLDQTLLLQATESSHKRVVKPLLVRGAVNPIVQTNPGEHCSRSLPQTSVFKS